MKAWNRTSVPVVRRLASGEWAVVKAGRIAACFPTMAAADRYRSRFKRNPSERAPQEARAAKLYRSFTGHRVSKRLRVRVNGLPRVALAIGPVLGIMYRTVRDGKVESYRHLFKQGARPLLAVAPDGRTAMLLGGDFAFTSRGFEDRA